MSRKDLCQQPHLAKFNPFFDKMDTWSNPKLKAMCKAARLPQGGNKDDMHQRLRGAVFDVHPQGA